MCTLVVLRRPGHDWPLVIGANRDEMLSRPWRKPGRHWDDRPEVVAGLDKVADGSWMGINDHALAAAVLNRVGSLGPQDGKRSRGELVLEALDHADADDAAAALAQIEPMAYRPFNLVIADNRDAWWLAHRGFGRVTATRLPEGVSLLTARELDDMTSPRIARYAARFRENLPADPLAGDWGNWPELLLDAEPAPGFGPESAMRFTLPNGFGTVSSSLLALPKPGLEREPVWRFARIAGGSDGEDAPGGWETIGLD